MENVTIQLNDALTNDDAVIMVRVNSADSSVISFGYS